MQTVVSFSTVSCKDLVVCKNPVVALGLANYLTCMLTSNSFFQPFHLENGKDCLAVIDHGTTSEVICGTAQTGYRLLNYLGTKRAVKVRNGNFAVLTKCLPNANANDLVNFREQHLPWVMNTWLCWRTIHSAFPQT